MAAYRLDSGQVVFAERGAVGATLTLPCGQCINCRLNRSQEWAIRCVHEASLHSQNSFITLTYNNDNLPANGSLYYRDVQLFLKRFRKRHPKIKISYYLAGEYGENFLVRTITLAFLGMLSLIACHFLNPDLAVSCIDLLSLIVSGV